MFSLVSALTNPSFSAPKFHKASAIIDCAGLIAATVLGTLGLIGVHYASVPPMGNWLMLAGGLGGLAFLGYKKIPKGFPNQYQIKSSASDFQF